MSLTKRYEELAFDPSQAIAEILGSPAGDKIDPKGNDFICPFVRSTCTKSRDKKTGEPYPVCSIRQSDGSPVAVCPKRFFQTRFLQDVISNCWPGPAPSNPEFIPEVKMRGFGNVDFVIADFDENDQVGQFLSVELQAIDITGSVRPAYDALRSGEMLDRRPTYGLNWDNVYKRYITQLIRKGYFHHHWGTKIVSVIQDKVFEYIIDRFDFLRTDNVLQNTVNIIFMTYSFVESNDAETGYELQLRQIEGTSHANLQMAALYADAPSRQEFSEVIVRSRSRALKS